MRQLQAALTTRVLLAGVWLLVTPPVLLPVARQLVPTRSGPSAAAQSPAAPILRAAPAHTPSPARLEAA